MRRSFYICLLGVGLSFGGCNESVIDCMDHPAWCQNFSLQPLRAINRADQSARLSVRLDQAEGQPSSAEHADFRVSIEQAVSGMPAIGGGLVLPAPGALADGWEVPLARPLPELQTMKCGPAKLYLHARLRSQPKQTTLVPATDPDSASYQQHGVADFQIFDERPPTFRGKGQLSGDAPLSNLGLHSSGEQLYVYATLDQSAANFTRLGLGVLTAQTGGISNITFADITQFVGDTGPARLLMKKTPGMPTLCDQKAARLTACTQLTSVGDLLKNCFPAPADFSWCFPAKSVAADAQGTLLAAVDADGKLRVHNLSIDSGSRTLTAPEWTSGQYTNYRHVAIGDLDGDGVMDVLALRQNDSPLVLLREGQSFNQNKQALATRWAGEFAKNSQVKASDAVVTMGRVDRCRDRSDVRSDVLVASAGSVAVLTPQVDQTFVKKKLALEMFPEGSLITALLLADTDANGDADLLLVATWAPPDKQVVYVYAVP